MAYRTRIGQVWTAPIRVRLPGGRPRRHPAAIIDVAPLVAVTTQVPDPAFDARSNTVTTGMAITNTSRELLCGPFLVRVVQIGSERGIPQILNADNGRGGEEAEWQVGGLGALQPGEATAGWPVRIRLHAMRRAREGSEYRFGLFSLDVRVFASRTSSCGG